MFQINVLEQITSCRIAPKSPVRSSEQRKLDWFTPVSRWEGGSVVLHPKAETRRFPFPSPLPPLPSSNPAPPAVVNINFSSAKT